MKLEQCSAMAVRMALEGVACLVLGAGAGSGSGGAKERATHRQQVALAVGSATATGEEQREQGSCFIVWSF